ncbi:SET domain protein [Rhizoctonia solani]|uniref:SET domain protein n=1 Tax=Rhizoctonia solani TaxID=456999 RepID=A0A8H8SXS7_9AGAM|nr:SET domain protein [Rhizoctonia solani]QRW22451.1 SET domain protein [Rhizoctonia solani]
MDEHQRKLLDKAMLQLSTQTLQQDENKETHNKVNHWFYFMEAFSYKNSSLLDRSNGNYHLFLDGEPHHPDSIMLEAQREANKTRHPCPVSSYLTTRDELIEHYKLLYEISPENSKSDDDSAIRQVAMLKVPEFVRISLESLSPIPISSMHLNKVHQEHYLIVRVISPAVRLAAIQVAIEDEQGSVIDLAMYHCFETSGLDRQGVIELVPLGQALLIRQPWLTRGLTGGNVTIRVSSPSDLIFLPPSHPLLSNCPEAWKAGGGKDSQVYKDIGNHAFKNGRFESAIQAYSHGLLVDPTASVLRLNRSACYLSINKPSMALKDAQIASEDKSMKDALRSKAQYRMALAYYALDRFSEALSILERNNGYRFSPADFSELEKKIHERLVEQAQGSYKWLALSKMAKQINGHRQVTDVADYVGPVEVALMESKGGGRGLVTTREVLAGELLMVSKPFAFAASSEYPELFRVLQARTGSVIERASHELVGRAMQRLVGDYTAASALFLDLHSNSPQTSTPQIARSVPTFLQNGGRYWDIPGECTIGDIDTNRVEGIIRSNEFNDSIKMTHFGNNEAIYLLPSLVNHSCHGTAVRTSIGSILVMRASRNLKKGQEVTCSYVGGTEGASYISRAAALRKWSFTCECELCTADKKDGEQRCQSREGLQEDLNQLHMAIRIGDAESAKNARELVTKIRATYGNERITPMDLLGRAQRLSGFTQQAFNPSLAIQLYTDGLRSHGIRVKKIPPKKIPRNNSELRRDALIIGTSNFPSQIDTIFRCIKVMVTLAALEAQQGKISLASHWAVASLWGEQNFPTSRMIPY